MVKFKNFSRPLSVFQVLFKANLFSSTFQDSLVYSSTFQACANPALLTDTIRLDGLIRWPVMYFKGWHVRTSKHFSVSIYLANSGCFDEILCFARFDQGRHCLQIYQIKYQTKMAEFFLILFVH